MADEPKKIRITVTVDELTAETISELAQRMNCSQSKMASSLLEAGIEDNEWIIRFVTTKAVLGLGERLIALKDRFTGSKSAA